MGELIFVRFIKNKYNFCYAYSIRPKCENIFFAGAKLSLFRFLYIKYVVSDYEKNRTENLGKNISIVKNLNEKTAN